MRHLNKSPAAFSRLATIMQRFGGSCLANPPIARVFLACPAAGETGPNEVIFFTNFITRSLLVFQSQVGLNPDRDGPDRDEKQTERHFPTGASFPQILEESMRVSQFKSAVLAMSLLVAAGFFVVNPAP